MRKPDNLRISVLPFLGFKEVLFPLELHSQDSYKTDKGTEKKERKQYPMSSQYLTLTSEESIVSDVFICNKIDYTILIFL